MRDVPAITTALHMLRTGTDPIYSMKRSLFALLPALLIAIGVAGCSSSRDVADNGGSDVLAIVGGEPIRIGEFERRYMRSATLDSTTAESMAAREDFLNRLVDFRLKVRAARDAGLDSHPELVSELESYRVNYARPYLLDQEVLDPLIRQTYERQRESIRARHILIRVESNASPQDTLTAYNRLSAVADSIRQGRDFGEMARLHSEDPSAQREGAGSAGDLGYFSSGQMVEPFESVAFATPVGETSGIFRTDFGYHILQVTDRIPTPEAIRVAHIVIAPDAHETDTISALDLAHHVYELLEAGEPFEVLARNYSHDRNSAARGGEIGRIDFASRVIEPFKTIAFSLENPGDYSEVVETPLGYHIIRLLGRVEAPTYEEAYDGLKQQVSRMPRAREAEQRLVSDLRSEMKARIDTASLYAELEHFETAELVRLIGVDSLEARLADKPIAYLQGEEFAVRDLQPFLAQSSRSAASTREALLTAANRLLDDKALDAGTRALELRDPEFGELMQEFREGLLLFRFMEDSIWTAAARDTTALLALFEETASEHTFPERQRIITVAAPDDSTLATFTTVYDESGLDAALEMTELQADTMLVSTPAPEPFDRVAALPVGGRTDSFFERGRRMIRINDGVEPARTKTFEEAMPALITVYQETLEERVMARLRRHYGVQLFPDRLAHVRRADPATPAVSEIRLD